MQGGRQVWIPCPASSLRDYRLAPHVLAGEVAAKMTAAQHLPGTAESTALLTELLALRTGVKDDQLLAVAAYNEMGRVYAKCLRKGGGVGRPAFRKRVCERSH